MTNGTSLNGTNTTAVNGTIATGGNGTATTGPKRKLFKGWGSDEAAIVIGGGCFAWWFYWGRYFLDKEFKRFAKHANKIKRPKKVTMKDRIYWVLGAIFSFFYGLYLRVDILNTAWKIRVDKAYRLAEQTWKDFSTMMTSVWLSIKMNLLTKAGRKKLFRKVYEKTLQSRVNDLRVSFVLRFENLPRHVAESEEFKSDLKTQIAYAAGYQIPLDMLDKHGQPVVLRQDNVTVEVEKVGWKMTTQNCNYHPLGYVQKSVKSERLAVRMGNKRPGAMEEGGKEEGKKGAKVKWSFSNFLIRIFFGKSVSTLIAEREANEALGSKADEKKRRGLAQVSRKIGMMTGAGLQARKLKIEADKAAAEEEERKKAGRIALGIKVYIPNSDSAHLFDRWIRGEDSDLPSQKIFEMVYTNTFIPDHGPIKIECGEKLRSRADMDIDDEYDELFEADMLQRVNTMTGIGSKKKPPEAGRLTLTRLWRWFCGCWTCFGVVRKRKIKRQVTRRHLETAMAKQPTEKERRMLAHYTTPFRRQLERARFKKGRLGRMWDAFYNTLHPEFRGVFEESFYNSFLHIHVEPGGQAHGTYGKNGLCKLEGVVGMAEDPGGKCPQFCGTFIEGNFKGDVRISMIDDGLSFEGRWFDQDGKPAGRWFGTRKRTLTERFMRFLFFHWFVPRKMAPASWTEEVAAARMQSAFRGHLSRVDIGLVSKQLQAEQMDQMAASGEMLPGAKKGWGKAKRTLTTAALAGQMKSMNSGGVSATSSTNFGALFAAKRAQLKGESEAEVRLDDLMTESEMLAAQALADDHLAMLADDTMRKNAALAAGAAAGNILGIFGLARKKKVEPPPPEELDMIVVPDKDKSPNNSMNLSPTASVDMSSPQPRSSISGREARLSTGSGGEARSPRSSIVFEKGGAAAQRTARKSRNSTSTPVRSPRSSVAALTSPRSSITSPAPAPGVGTLSAGRLSSTGTPGGGRLSVGGGGSVGSGSGGVGAPAPMLKNSKLGSASEDAIRAIAGEGYFEEDSVGDEMPVWLAYLRMKHYLHVIMIVYEVINLWSFVFADSVPWPSRFARNVFRLATGDFRGDVFPPFFFLQWSTYMFLFGFWLLDLFLVPPKLEAAFAAELKEVLQSADSMEEMYAAMDWKTVPAVLFELFTGLKRLLMEGFYMPTMVSCFNMLACRYPGTGKPFLQVYPQKECWNEEHIIEALMAGTLLFAIYIATMYISCSVKPYHATLYRWDPIFEGQFLMSKALSCGLATLGVNTFGGRLQIYVLAGNLGQLWYTQWTQQPCRGRAAAVNNLRTASFAMQFVGAICGIALVEGDPNWPLYRESIGFFYALAALPVFMTSWYVNNDRSEGQELPAVDLVELLKMEVDENGLLKLRKSAKIRSSQVAPGPDDDDNEEDPKKGGKDKSVRDLLFKGAAGAAEGKDVEALVQTDHLACSPGRMGIRVKLVAAVSLTYLMMEDQNLKAVKDGVRHVLRMCAEDNEFHKVARTLLSKYFGKQAPKEYKHNTLLKGARLTLSEAQIVTGHLKSAVGLETIVIRAVYPLARIRRNTLKSFDLQATAIVGEVTLADALILKELMRPVAKLTTLRYISISGALPLPVGDLLEGDIEHFSSEGAPLTSGDLIIMSEYIRINHSLQTLDLSNANIGPEGIEALGNALRKQRTIESVDLSGNTVCLAAISGSREAEEALKSFVLLGNALNENVSIQTLKTHKLDVPVAMLRARKNAPRIKLVDFSNTSRGVLPRDPHESLYDTDIAVIARLLKGAPIDALDLSGNCITGNGANHLCKVLADPVGTNAAMNIVQICDLDLSSNNLGSKGCKELGTALRRNANLRRLNLADNKINVHGAWYIAGILSATRPGEKTAYDIRGRSIYLSALETLILSDNPLGAPGVKSIANHLGAGGEHEPGKLKHLDLSNTNAHAEGGVALGNMLKHNNHLRVLELRGAKLSSLEENDDHSDDATKEIGAGLGFNATLETLVLEDNGIPSRGCHMLSEGLFHNRSLVTLDISHNRVGMNVQAMQEILQLILAENLTLKHFIIAGNPVGPGVLSLVKQWEQMQEQRRMERDAAGQGGVGGIGVPGGVSGGVGRVGSQTFSIGPGAMTSVGVFPSSLFPADASLGSFALPGLPSVAPGGGGGGGGGAAFPAAAMAMPGVGVPNRMAPAPSVAGPYTAPGVNPGMMMPQPFTDSLQQAVPSTFARGMPPPPPGAPVQPPPMPPPPPPQ